MSISAGLSSRFEKMRSTREDQRHGWEEAPPTASLYAHGNDKADRYTYKYGGGPHRVPSVSVATSPMRQEMYTTRDGHARSRQHAAERTILIGGPDTMGGPDNSASSFAPPFDDHVSHRRAAELPSSPFSYRGPHTYSFSYGGHQRSNGDEEAAQRGDVKSYLQSNVVTTIDDYEGGASRPFGEGRSQYLGPSPFPPPQMFGSSRDPRSMEGNYVDEEDRIADDQHAFSGQGHRGYSTSVEDEALRSPSHPSEDLPRRTVIASRLAVPEMPVHTREGSTNSESAALNHSGPLKRTASTAGGYRRSVSPPLAAIPLSSALSPPRYVERSGEGGSGVAPNRHQWPLSPPTPYEGYNFGSGSKFPFSSNVIHVIRGSTRSQSRKSNRSEEKESAKQIIRENFQQQNHPYGPAQLVDGSIGMSGAGSWGAKNGGGVPGKLAEERIGLVGVVQSPPRLAYRGVGAVDLQGDTSSALFPRDRSTALQLSKDVPGFYRGSVAHQRQVSSLDLADPFPQPLKSSATPLTDLLLRKFKSSSSPEPFSEFQQRRPHTTTDAYSRPSLHVKHKHPLPHVTAPTSSVSNPLTDEAHPYHHQQRHLPEGNEVRSVGREIRNASEHGGRHHVVPAVSAAALVHELTRPHASSEGALAPSNGTDGPPAVMERLISSTDPFSENHASISLFEAEAAAEPATLTFPASANAAQQTVAPFNGLFIPVPPQLMTSVGAVRDEDLIMRCQVAESVVAQRSRTKGLAVNDKLSLLQQVVKRCRILRDQQILSGRGEGLQRPDTSYFPRTPHPSLEDSFQKVLRAGSAMALYSTREDPVVRHLRIDVLSDHSGLNDEVYIEDGIVGRPLFVWSKHRDSSSVSGTMPLWDLVEVSTSPDVCPVLARFFADPRGDVPNRRVGGSRGRGIIGPRLGGSRPSVLPSTNIIRMLFSSGVELVWIALEGDLVAQHWASCLHYIAVELGV